jgi:O-antigen chain-terminating methyltransferase
VSDSSLTDLLTRLERERVEADRSYNEALTALDHALPGAIDLPCPPAPLDDARVADANRAYNVREAVSDGAFPDRRLREQFELVVTPVLERQQRFNSAIVDHLNRNVEADRQTRRATAELIDATRRHLDGIEAFHSRLIQFLQQITPYIDTKARALGGSDLREQIGLANERTLALKREIERLQSDGPRPAGGSAPAAVPASADRDAFKYLGFEDRFRGPREEVRRRLADYVPLFTGASEVLDVGCGRGELLELFRDAGISARGIDTNERMVSVCVERGLRAEQNDGLTFLRAQTDGSLGGLLAIQVVEHLPPDYLMAFLEAAYHALRPGSTIVLETINVACWSAFFDTYMRDLTHVRPLHAETLKFVVEASGFTAADIQYRSPVLDADRLAHVSVPSTADPSWRALADALNAHADKLNARMFSSMDYAVVARRA